MKINIDVLRRALEKQGFSPRDTRALVDVVDKGTELHDAIVASQEEVLFERGLVREERDAKLQEIPAILEHHDRETRKAQDAAAGLEAKWRSAERVAIECRLLGNATRAHKLGEVALLEKELAASADPRIAKFLFELEELREQARHSGRTWITNIHRNTHLDSLLGNGPLMASNAVERDAGVAALAQEQAFCHELELMVIGSKGVTASLRASCARLAKALAPIELNPPSMDGHDEPGPAVTWHGASQWDFDEPQQRPLRDSQVALRAAAEREHGSAAKNKGGARR